MPNSLIAIRDPFNQLPLFDALMVAVLGMVVVFIVLAVLALMIVVISKVVAFIERGKKSAAPAAKAAPVPAPAPKQEDDEEVIAVITAAVAAEMGTTPDQTRLTSIMRY